MAKFKITEGTWTVWSQETKQVNLELEDGRVLGVRVMEDDNGSETYYQLKPKGEEIWRRGGWETEDKVEWDSDELKEASIKFAQSVFYGDYETGDEIDTDELEDIWI